MHINANKDSLTACAEVKSPPSVLPIIYQTGLKAGVIRME